MGICCKRGGEHVQGPWVGKKCGTFKTEELDFSKKYLNALESHQGSQDLQDQSTSEKEAYSDEPHSCIYFYLQSFADLRNGEKKLGGLKLFAVSLN